MLILPCKFYLCWGLPLRPNFDSSTRTWFGLCEETKQAVFAYHSTPDHLLSNVLLEVYGRISRDANQQSTFSPYPLTRFLFLF